VQLVAATEIVEVEQVLDREVVPLGDRVERVAARTA